MARLKERAGCLHLAGKFFRCLPSADGEMKSFKDACDRPIDFRGLNPRFGEVVKTWRALSENKTDGRS